MPGSWVRTTTSTSAVFGGFVPSASAARAGSRASAARSPATIRSRPGSSRLDDDRRPPGGVGPVGEPGAGHRSARRPAFGVRIAREAEDPLPGHRWRQGVGHDHRHVPAQDPGRHRRGGTAGDGQVGAALGLGQLPGPGRVAGVVARPDHHLPPADPALGIEQGEGQDEAELEGAAPAGGRPRQVADRADLVGRSAGGVAAGHPQRHRRQRLASADDEGGPPHTGLGQLDVGPPGAGRPGQLGFDRSGGAVAGQRHRHLLLLAGRGRRGLDAAGGGGLDGVGQEGRDPVAARRRRREGHPDETAPHHGVGQGRAGQHASLLGRQRLAPALGHTHQRGGEHEDADAEHRLGPQQPAHRPGRAPLRHRFGGPPPGRPARRARA